MIEVRVVHGFQEFRLFPLDGLAGSSLNHPLTEALLMASLACHRIEGHVFLLNSRQQF